MSAPILTVDGLTVDYTTHEGSRRAVDGVSLEIAAGEVLGVVGESGSGKSTIAQTIIGLQAANARIVGGSVKLGDLDLLASGRRTWRQVRGTRIALVPQDPNNSLTTRRLRSGATNEHHLGDPAYRPPGGGRGREAAQGRREAPCRARGRAG